MLTEQKNYKLLAKKYGLANIYLKREDTHPHLSHKGRSIPPMIEEKIKQGFYDFAISSSGNAGLSACFFVRDYNLKHKEKINLKVFTGKKIPVQKITSLKKFENPYIKIIQADNPKQTAFLEAKKENIALIRQSTDDSALSGYKKLAEELTEIKNLNAVFVPTSSGTTAQALAEFLPENIEIHIVQTEACHPISREFDKNFSKKEKSIAGAIVDQVAHRKKELIKAMKKRKGSGWIVSDSQIKQAIEEAKEIGINISPNSALSIAGLKKALQAGWRPKGEVACLITGN